MSAALPFSTIRFVLAPDEFAMLPEVAISWARDLIDAGFTEDIVYDLVTTDPTEWQRISRLLRDVARAVGIDLLDDERLRDLAIDLISTHLASGGTGRKVLEEVSSSGLRFDDHWRGKIENLFRGLWYIAEDTLSGIMPGVPDNFDPPDLTRWVTLHWRDLLAQEGWPQGSEWSA